MRLSLEAFLFERLSQYPESTIERYSQGCHSRIDGRVRGVAFIDRCQLGPIEAFSFIDRGIHVFTCSMFQSAPESLAKRKVEWSDTAIEAFGEQGVLER